MTSKQTTRRHFYSIEYTSATFNYSDALLRDWGGAQILRSTSKAQRDDYCAGHPYRLPISAKRAAYITCNFAGFAYDYDPEYDD